MKAKVTLDQLVSAAVKGGHNEEDARKVIATNYDYIIRMYNDYSKREMVNIAYTIF